MIQAFAELREEVLWGAILCTMLRLDHLTSWFHLVRPCDCRSSRSGALPIQPFIELPAVDADAAPDPDGGQLAGAHKLVSLSPADAKQLLDVLQTQPLRMLRVTHELSFGALLFPTIAITMGPSQCSGEGTRVNEAVLRARWEERVTTKNQKVLDELWQDLKDERYVDDALSEPEIGLEDLVQEAETRLKYWRLGGGRKKPVGRSARTPVEVELDRYEKECAEIVSLYLAKKAASSPKVRRFRQERLGGKLLTTEEAEEFLRGELLRDLPDDPHSLSWLDQSFIAEVGVMGLEHLLDFAVPIDRWPAVGSSQHLLFPHEGSDGRIVSDKRIAKNYSDLCIYLAAIFPWDPYDAALFLLTGERPEVVPLELSYNRYRRVFTLNFAPWISEKTFRKAYRKCQTVVQGGDNRRMKGRTLAVMRFVTKHTDDEGNRPPWSKLTDLWNKNHPGEWRFKDRFGMRKTYLRGEEEL